MCHRAVVIDGGQIVADGPPAKLIEMTDAYTLEGAFQTLTSEERIA